jgi:RimJ/RimL family protein N-acetyltransferase
MTDEPQRFVGVPEQLDAGDGFTLRRMSERDVEELVAVANANLEHLRPWMPWAAEPLTLDGQLEWWRTTEAWWTAGTDFVYAICGPDGAIVGGAGLHQRQGPGVLEIGYWIAADQAGRGVVGRVTRALARLAGSLPGVTHVEIRCDEANERSAAIPRRLGFRLSGSEVRPPVAPAETTRLLVWTLGADDAASL